LWECEEESDSLWECEEESDSLWGCESRTRGGNVSTLPCTHSPTRARSPMHAHFPMHTPPHILSPAHARFPPHTRSRSPAHTLPHTYVPTHTLSRAYSRARFPMHAFPRFPRQGTVSLEQKLNRAPPGRSKREVMDSFRAFRRPVGAVGGDNPR